MAILRSFEEKEMPSFLKLLARAKTGDIIDISPAPKNLASYQVVLPHMLGMFSIIHDCVYLNDTEICRNDIEQTHSSDFYPFCRYVLFCRKDLKGKKVVYNFYRIDPSNPASITNLPKPAFQYEAEELKIIPLSSGRGLILIESKPKERIVLLKRFSIFGTTWNKITADKITIACEGDYVRYVESPHSIVVGMKVTSPSDVPTTRFYRGPVGKQDIVHNHVGNKEPSYFATDNDFFYSSEVGGQEVIISVATGKPVYAGVCRDNLHVTAGALVLREGTVIKANGRLITNTFCANNEPVLDHAYGLLFTWFDRIQLFVIKESIIEAKK